MCAENSKSVSWWDMSSHEVRAKINQRIMSIDAEILAVGSVVDQVVQRENRITSIRIYTPRKGDHFPIVLLIHGGAWVAGSIDTHDNLARYLCTKTHTLVISVGYLNAPEGKFPLPLEQCYDALLWAAQHAEEMRAHPSKLAVIGDSAGGNMTAALCLMARDRKGPKISAQVMINPAPDLTCNGTLERKGDSLDSLRWQAINYLSDPRDAYHPYASPLVAATDLCNLPAATLILAEQDELRDSGQHYADRLKEAGIPTYVYCQNDIGHLAGHGARASEYAKKSLDVAVIALRHAFFTD
jgi:acetyl esterase